MQRMFCFLMVSPVFFVLEQFLIRHSYCSELMCCIWSKRLSYMFKNYEYLWKVCLKTTRPLFGFMQPILCDFNCFSQRQASERKAYNPKTFCRTYTMDKQPLNTGEQKDMTEFFTDLIGKIEEMSPALVRNVIYLLDLSGSWHCIKLVCLVYSVCIGWRACFCKGYLILPFFCCALTILINYYWVKHGLADW